MYKKMPFGLMNVGATFQRAMDISFIGEKDRFVVIYLDDITIFSASDEEHLQHLKKTFEKSRRYGISLNPKKSHFSMEEGKLLGHIVSPEAIKIDPERVKAIQQIDILRNEKSIHSFIGKIDFLRRFIPNFAEIVKYITNIVTHDFGHHDDVGMMVYSGSSLELSPEKSYFLLFLEISFLKEVRRLLVYLPVRMHDSRRLP
jgi:hypothetical protein